MTPLLTLWPSALTSRLSDIVKEYCEADSTVAPLYRALQCNGITDKEISHKISECYRELITLTMPDTVLHVIAVFPLWDEGCREMLEKVRSACRLVTDRVSLHVIGLTSSIKRVLDMQVADEDAVTDASNRVMLTEESMTAKFPFSFTFIEDYVANGAPLGMTERVLGHYLSRIFTALIYSYYSVLPMAITGNNRGANISLGIATVTFPHKTASLHLLHRAFIAALELAGIGGNRVDADKASDISCNLLAGQLSRYKQLLDKKVMPIFRQEKWDEASLVAHVRPMMMTEIREMENDVEAIIKNKDYTLAEREAILALVLGRDNQRLSGLQYDRETYIIDDTCSDAIDLYVDTFNKVCKGSGLLPVRGDYPALKNKKFFLEELGLIEDETNYEAFNPLPRLKKLKLEILNEMAFVRRKKQELKELTDAEQARKINEGAVKDQMEEIAEHLTPRFVEIKEEPLEKKYVPRPGLVPKNSVDLRKFFSPVKNQGALGSCATFAVVSMYEAIMNSVSQSPVQADLSERFVYYFSNVAQGKPEGGSNYYDQLEVLMKHGVCSEALFGYSDTDTAKEPGPEAVQDAASHRVLEAMQIPLVDNVDKMATIRENHRLITCALSEGWPVGIGLKVYDSFGKNGAFINCPDREDVSSGGEGYHAMVVVGYSEKDKCYIVRNSWGRQFGDEGYCYVSAAYIDDPEYNNYACIITRTTDNEGKTAEVTPALVAPFAGTENQIKIAAIRNVLDEMKVEISTKQLIYNENYKYYQHLMQRLGLPSVRNEIRKRSEDKCREELARLEGEKNELLTNFTERIKEFKWQYIVSAASLTSFTLLLAIIVYYFPLDWLEIITIVLAVITVFVWLNYAWRVRARRRELQAELDDIAGQAARVERELTEMQFRFHFAGIWIDAVHEMILRLSKTYEHLFNFNQHLARWYTEEQELASERIAVEGEMFTDLSDYVLWDRYFETNEAPILSRINLMDAFDGYMLNRESIDAARERLGNLTMEAIRPLFADFNMVDYLLGTTYAYMPPANLEAMITRQLNVGQPSTRNSQPGQNVPTRVLLVNVKDSCLNQWNTAVNPYFPYRPTVAKVSNPDSLDIVTIQVLEPTTAL